MSEPLPPAALAAVTTASGLPAMPRAVRHFGLAAMEARAHRAGSASPPRPVLAPVIPTPVVPAPIVPAPAPPVADRQVKVRLWLPLTPLFLLLAPFAFVLALPCYLIPPRRRPDPILTAFAAGRVLLALGGTFVNVETPGALVRIRIF